MTTMTQLSRAIWRPIVSLFGPRTQPLAPLRSLLPRTGANNPPRLATFVTTTPCQTYVHGDNEEDQRSWPEPKRWPRKNEYTHPPQELDEPRRPATYCHYRSNIKYSPKKMWYIGAFIRGMTVDEAIKQLQFIPKKGAQIAKEVIEEARDIAVKEHNFEFRSNMWIGEAYCGKGLVLKGMRKHARFRIGITRVFYTHFFVRLVEGDPPEHYYPPKPSGNEYLSGYVHGLRNRRVAYIK